MLPLVARFLDADYAFDKRVLSLPLTELIEASGKHWVTEVEPSRKVMWEGQWHQFETVATQLKAEHPESFRDKLDRLLRK